MCSRGQGRHGPALQGFMRVSCHRGAVRRACSQRPRQRQALPARACARTNSGSSAAAWAACSAASLNWPCAGCQFWLSAQRQGRQRQTVRRRRQLMQASQHADAVRCYADVFTGPALPEPAQGAAAPPPACRPEARQAAGPAAAASQPSRPTRPRARACMSAAAATFAGCAATSGASSAAALYAATAPCRAGRARSGTRGSPLVKHPRCV